LTGEQIAEVDVPDGARVSGASWSPDGERIAFFARFPDATHIYVADPESGDSRRVTCSPVLATHVTSFDWSEDGEHIVTVLVPGDLGTRAGAARCAGDTEGPADDAREERAAHLLRSARELRTVTPTASGAGCNGGPMADPAWFSCGASLVRMKRVKATRRKRTRRGRSSIASRSGPVRRSASFQSAPDVWETVTAALDARPVGPLGRLARPVREQSGPAEPHHDGRRAGRRLTAETRLRRESTASEPVPPPPGRRGERT
jgi:dipeptidyl aminopeptidase/acylaminoacyl peptidase